MGPMLAPWTLLSGYMGITFLISWAAFFTIIVHLRLQWKRKESTTTTPCHCGRSIPATHMDKTIPSGINLSVVCIDLPHKGVDSYDPTLGMRQLQKGQVTPQLTSRWIDHSSFLVAYFMITSSNGNIFRVTAHLCGVFTSHWWISRTKASDAEHWCFVWSLPE